MASFVRGDRQRGSPRDARRGQTRPYHEGHCRHRGPILQWGHSDHSPNLNLSSMRDDGALWAQYTIIVRACYHARVGGKAGEREGKTMARTASATVPLVRRMRIPADVAAICLVIILADIVSGISAPTFPLHARSLGLDLATIGWLPASSGVVSLCLALPIGLLSDRIGRRRVIVGGMFAFALGMFCVGVAHGLPLLLVGCLLFGAAGVATFQIGAALLGDVTTPGQRAMAFGLYTTAMGVGFTIGPLIGGQVAERAGTGRGLHRGGGHRGGGRDAGAPHPPQAAAGRGRRRVPGAACAASWRWRGGRTWRWPASATS